MYTRQDPSQQWTVHAQFTISHDGINDPNGAPQTHTEQDENGVRMVYTWTSQPGGAEGEPTPGEGPSSQAFQRGNMVFTSTPPTRRPFNEDATKLGVDSSGYGSELLSPNSFASSNLPRRNSQPYNRRCRSTCSIVLSTDFNEQLKPEDSECQSQCGRTHSLRCQTPTLRCDRKDAYYGCGDPWCYHSNYPDDLRFSPVPEGEEYNTSNPSKRPSRASTYTQSRSKSSPPRFDRRNKDVSVQTVADKCTSPLMKMDSLDFKRNNSPKTQKKRSPYNARRKTEPIRRRSRSPSSLTPDSLESQQTVWRAVRTAEVKNSASNSSDPNKKPRTVHIDVYCTGTELDSSSSDSDERTSSTPQTVFESGKVRITHRRPEEGELPFHLKEDKVESETEDGISTAYPSRSSFSGLRDSSLSSVPPSWSTMSMSSYAVPDDESTLNTSWKDTVSDFGSMSRSSITQTDSLDFVPRKLLQNQTCSSIDERLETPSSLQPSDSFEYANSEDKSRIKKMENLWGKPWRSPQTERKQLLQQQRMKEYIEAKIGGDNKDSDSGSDGSEKGWSFVGRKLERDTTVRRAGNVEPSPSLLVIKQKIGQNPTLRAPFTVVPGVYTEQRSIAKRFGRIVDVFKKPGHHVGPAKNPDCACDHCRSHFEDVGFRGRAKSVDSQQRNFYYWKELARASEPRAELNGRHENMSASQIGRGEL